MKIFLWQLPKHQRMNVNNIKIFISQILRIVVKLLQQQLIQLQIKYIKNILKLQEIQQLKEMKNIEDLVSIQIYSLHRNTK